jgi:hypothetical protein
VAQTHYVPSYRGHYYPHKSDHSALRHDPSDHKRGENKRCVVEGLNLRAPYGRYLVTKQHQIKLSVFSLDPNKEYGYESRPKSDITPTDRWNTSHHPSGYPKELRIITHILKHGQDTGTEQAEHDSNQKKRVPGGLS